MDGEFKRYMCQLERDIAVQNMLQSLDFVTPEEKAELCQTVRAYVLRRAREHDFSFIRSQQQEADEKSTNEDLGGFHM